MPGVERRLLAEAIGTFCLVFAGTGAMVVDEVSGGRVTHLGTGRSRGGLRREGRLRGYLKRNDEARDEYIFGVTRRDWESGRRARGRL